MVQLNCKEAWLATPYLKPPARAQCHRQRVPSLSQPVGRGSLIPSCRVTVATATAVTVGVRPARPLPVWPSQVQPAWATSIAAIATTTHAVSVGRPPLIWHRRLRPLHTTVTSATSGTHVVLLAKRRLVRPGLIRSCQAGMVAAVAATTTSGNAQAARPSLASAAALGFFGVISLAVLTFLSTAELAVQGAWALHVLLFGPAASIPVAYIGNWLLGWVPAVAACYAAVLSCGFATCGADALVRTAVAVGAAAALAGGLSALLPSQAKTMWISPSGNPAQNTSYAATSVRGNDASTAVPVPSTASTGSSQNGRLVVQQQWWRYAAIVTLLVRVAAAVAWGSGVAEANRAGSLVVANAVAMSLNAVLVGLQAVGLMAQHGKAGRTTDQGVRRVARDTEVSERQGALIGSIMGREGSRGDGLGSGAGGTPALGLGGG